MLLLIYNELKHAGKCSVSWFPTILACHPLPKGIKSPQAVSLPLVKMTR